MDGASCTCCKYNGSFLVHLQWKTSRVRQYIFDGMARLSVGLEFFPGLVVGGGGGGGGGGVKSFSCQTQLRLY